MAMQIFEFFLFSILDVVHRTYNSATVPKNFSFVSCVDLLWISTRKTDKILPRLETKFKTQRKDSNNCTFI